MCEFRHYCLSLLRYLTRRFDTVPLNDMKTNKVLVKNTVHTRNPANNETAAKLTKIAQAGPNQLQIITDFDYTISKSLRSNATLNCTTHGIFDSVANGVDPALQEQLRLLRDKYYPIEMDPQLSADEKLPLMEEWWKTSHDLIVRECINKKSLEHYVKAARVELRDGVMEFLKIAEYLGIPVVIFSAGLGNLIEIILRQQYGSVPDNVHIISNLMQFNDSGTIVGFQPPLIHTFNKNFNVIQMERPFFEKLKSRPNVLLLGDTLGDLHMDVGVVNEGTVLKLGFLNQKVTESLPTYLAGYDIVVTEDQTFDVPLAILRDVAGT